MALLPLFKPSQHMGMFSHSNRRKEREQSTFWPGIRQNLTLANFSCTIFSEKWKYLSEHDSASGYGMDCTPGMKRKKVSYGEACLSLDCPNCFPDCDRPCFCFCTSGDYTCSGNESSLAMSCALKRIKEEITATHYGEVGEIQLM